LHHTRRTAEGSAEEDLVVDLVEEDLAAEREVETAEAAKEPVAAVRVTAAAPKEVSREEVRVGSRWSTPVP
jgi:hypothetical protein